MAQLIVRNLDDEIVRRLRKLAAASGRSVEAEHREILKRALLGSKRNVSLKEILLGMPCVGRDDDFSRERQKPRKVRL
jgi:plasmid stability protein